MSRQLVKLTSMYRDLVDRYGAHDPMVVRLQAEMERRQAEAAVLPHGERRKTDLAPHLWNQRLRPRGAFGSPRPGDEP